MIAFEELEDSDPAKQRLHGVQQTLDTVSTIPEKGHRGFASGRFISGVNALSRLYLLVDFGWRSLRQMYLQDLGMQLPSGDDVVVSKWWRAPVGGFSEVPAAIALAARTYVEKSGIDPALMSFLPGALAQLSREIAGAGGLCFIDSCASKVRVAAQSSSLGEAHHWLLFGSESRKFASLYLSERKFEPPAGEAVEA